MKHTKGKWIIDTESDNQIWIVQEDGNLIIAKINQGELPGGQFETTEEERANAQLIASSPELLEALKVAIKLIRFLDPKDTQLGHVESFEQAIKKAEGS